MCLRAAWDQVRLVAFIVLNVISAWHDDADATQRHHVYATASSVDNRLAIILSLRLSLLPLLPINTQSITSCRQAIDCRCAIDITILSWNITSPKIINNSSFVNQSCPETNNCQLFQWVWENLCPQFQNMLLRFKGFNHDENEYSYRLGSLSWLQQKY